jgi:hypothetical protein
MLETPRLRLPLLQPSQAQKHVTMNEALVLLDGLAQLSLVSRSLAVPPAPVPDGACYGVPAGGQGAWAGQDGMVAVGSGGGWVCVPPADGWRAWVADEGTGVVWTAGAWRLPAVSAGPSGAAVRMLTEESEHDLLPGGAQDLSVALPAKSMVLAVSARVLSPITGTATSWRLGVPGAEDRFGSGLGLSGGAYADGILGAPMTNYGAVPLRVAPEGGTIAGGRIRVARHYICFDLPGV